MNVSQEEELLALGSALYLIGLEVEASRSKLSQLFDNGVRLSSPEMMEENKTFNKLSLEFCRLEERFLALKKRVRKKVSELGKPHSSITPLALWRSAAIMGTYPLQYPLGFHIHEKQIV